MFASCIQVTGSAWKQLDIHGRAATEIDNSIPPLDRVREGAAWPARSIPTLHTVYLYSTL